MGHEQICAWLQIPCGTWPPDHYTLLGLQPGESSIALIEQQVHERMEKVRVYQLANPEPATEAMNRLAQALICLTDARSKKTYDQALLGTRDPLLDPPPVRRAPNLSPKPAPPEWLFGAGNPSGEEEIQQGQGQSLASWETEPPPRRLLSEPAPADPVGAVPQPGEAPLAETATAPESNGAAGPQLPPPAARTPPNTPLYEPSRWRRGLGTRRALYRRIAWHRQLHSAWLGAGKYLNRPSRLLHRPAEATDFIEQMQTMRTQLKMLPLFGEAGQPGYLVLTLARQQMIVPTLQTLLPSQRQALARDWQAGLGVLNSQRAFLRQETRALRQRSRWRQGLRVVVTSVLEHPGTLVLLIAWAALNVAYPRVRERWPEQGVCFLAALGIRIAFWKYSFAPVRRRSLATVQPIKK